MNEKNGADSGCALFFIMTKGYAGSYGAALKCMERKTCPDGFREDIWIRLKAWAERILDTYDDSHMAGSIHEALWEIGKEGFGFKVNLRDIPVEQEAVEIAEALDLNIYDLASSDFEAAVFGPDIPEGYSIIGYAKKGRDKLLINGDEVSYLNRPPSQT